MDSNRAAPSYVLSPRSRHHPLVLTDEEELVRGKGALPAGGVLDFPAPNAASLHGASELPCPYPPPCRRAAPGNPPMDGRQVTLHGAVAILLDQARRDIPGSLHPESIRTLHRER